MESATGESLETLLKESFKLSSYEAKAYLALLKHGKQNPKQLASSSEVPLPRIYDTMESLMSKGFALKQEELCSAIPPRQALRGRSKQFELQFTQEQKQRQLVEGELAGELEQLGRKTLAEAAAEGGEISILKGFNAIVNKFSELLEHSSHVVLVAKRAMEAKELLIPILLEYGQAKKNKKLRIIVPEEAVITQEELRAAKLAGMELRKSDQILFDMIVTDSDDVIIGVPDPLSEELNHSIAIWVRNSSFARSTRSAIEESWKKSARVGN